MVTGVAASPGIFSATPGFAGIDPGETETFQVVFTPTSVGTYTGTLVLTSNDPLEEVYTIVLKGKYLVPPDISLTPGSMEAVANRANIRIPPSQCITQGAATWISSFPRVQTRPLFWMAMMIMYTGISFKPYYYIPMSQFTFECWIYFEEFYNIYEPIFNASVCYSNYNMDISLTAIQLHSVQLL